MQHVATIVGRALLAPMFVVGGVGAVRDPGRRVGTVDAAGLPEPELLVRLNGVAMTIGGVALALGIKPRLASALLIGCLVPTTVVGHAFWKVEDPAARGLQRTNFVKNVAMVGGLVLVQATGSPRSSTRRASPSGHTESVS